MLHDSMRSALPVSDLPRKLAWRDERMAQLRALRVKLGPFEADPDGH